MLLDWTVLGGVGFEELRLGDDREVVRARLGHYRSFPVDPGFDQYLEVRANVKYDEQGKAYFIEVTRPCVPRLYGVELLGRSLSEVAEDLRVHDLTVVEDKDGGIVADLDVGLYVPIDVIESVSVPPG